MQPDFLSFGTTPHRQDTDWTEAVRWLGALQNRSCADPANNPRRTDSYNRVLSKIAASIDGCLLECAYALVPDSADYLEGADSGSFGVFAPSGCAWSAVSDSAWLVITSTGGSGNGTVDYTISANAGDARTGTITVLDQTFTVNQEAKCNNWDELEWYEILPSNPVGYEITGTPFLNTFDFHYYDTGNNNVGGNRMSAWIPAWGPEAGCTYEVTVVSTVTPEYVSNSITDRGISLEVFEADKTTSAGTFNIGALGFVAVQRINGTQTFVFSIPAAGAVAGRWFHFRLTWDCRHTPTVPMTWDATVTMVTTTV